MYMGVLCMTYRAANIVDQDLENLFAWISFFGLTSTRGRFKRVNGAKLDTVKGRPEYYPGARLKYFTRS